MKKEEIREVIENNDWNIQSAYVAIFAADLVFRAYANSGKIYGMKYSPVCCYFSFRDLEAFYQIIKEESLRSLSGKVYEEFLEDNKSLDEKIEKHMNLSREMDGVWGEYVDKCSGNVDNQCLLKYFQVLTEKSFLWWQIGVIGEDKAEVVNQKVIPAFQKRHNLSFEEAKDAIYDLSHPDEMTFFNQERKMFFEICVLISDTRSDTVEDILSDEKVKEKIEKYLKRFFWVKNDFYRSHIMTPGEIVKDAIGEISKKGIENIKKDLEKIDDNFSEIKKRQKELLDSLDLSEKDLKDIEFSKKVIHWFDFRKFGMMTHLHYIYQILEEIARVNKIDYHECCSYLTKELIDLMKNGVSVDENVIQKRRESSFIVYNEDENERIFGGSEGRDLFDLVMKKDSEEKTLKGTVASKGKSGDEKVIGKARIVIRPQDAVFEEGEFLVTSMTRVEFVPLMRKAGAIITNEGGLACHAAIVSREMGLPAIIGTKNATQVLRDGDEVEMDLKSGEVRVVG
ncbi:MAG: PEP-utilizing enzyme [Candidatus Moranbacteria bacterium]|nr:PEP-utilizing enzyme [Candidatus Moranbacteria bacterium]